MMLFNLYYERKYCTEHEEGGMKEGVALKTVKTML